MSVLSARNVSMKTPSPRDHRGGVVEHAQLLFARVAGAGWAKLSPMDAERAPPELLVELATASAAAATEGAGVFSADAAAAAASVRDVKWSISDGESMLAALRVRPGSTDVDAAPAPPLRVMGFSMVLPPKSVPPASGRASRRRRLRKLVVLSPNPQTSAGWFS